MIDRAAIIEECLAVIDIVQADYDRGCGGKYGGKYSEVNRQLIVKVIRGIYEQIRALAAVDPAPTSSTVTVTLKPGEKVEDALQGMAQAAAENQKWFDRAVPPAPPSSDARCDDCGDHGSVETALRNYCTWCGKWLKGSPPAPPSSEIPTREELETEVEELRALVGKLNGRAEYQELMRINNGLREALATPPSIPEREKVLEALKEAYHAMNSAPLESPSHSFETKWDKALNLVDAAIAALEGK